MNAKENLTGTVGGTSCHRPVGGCADTTDPPACAASAIGLARRTVARPAGRGARRGLLALLTAVCAGWLWGLASTPSPMQAVMPSLEGQPRGLASKQPSLQQNYGRLPMRFEPNVGQTDEEVKYLARGAGYTLFLTETEAILALRPRRAPDRPVWLSPQAMGRHENRISMPTAEQGRPSGAAPQPGVVSVAALSGEAQGAVVRMHLEGNAHQTASKIEGLERLPGISNYLIGNDPGKWHTRIAHYAQVKYRDVYPGIDLVYYGNPRQLEYDFVLAPGADPSQIQIAFEGAEDLQVADNGDLLLMVNGGELVQRAPKFYQEIDGQHRALAGRYLLTAGGGGQAVGLAAEGAPAQPLVGFQVASHDPALAMTIDPTLVYSTYYGGADIDEAWGVAVDGSGNAYVTGLTASSDFPTANALDPTYSGGYYDAFVIKLNPSGSAALYATYLGGATNGDLGMGIAVDGSGNAYITGQTASSDFPTANALDATLNGDSDAFVVKLNSSGSAALYATYLGGADDELGAGIAVDGNGNAYVTGVTKSSDFPTANALDTTLTGDSDAFVVKLNASGSAALYSTYLGGSGTEEGIDLLVGGIAADGSGNAYVTGVTSSRDFPTVNAFDTGLSGSSDAFVVKLNPSGSTALYSTYLGGNSDDYGRGIAVDGSRNAYVTGETKSGDFPTVNAFDSVLSGDTDAFVAKLNPSGSAPLYATYLGGNSDDTAVGIAADDSGNAYVTGLTASGDFPTVDSLDASLSGDSDAFVVKLNSSGSAAIYSTYLGGSSVDVGGGIALDGNGGAYLAGVTLSGDFPTSNPLYFEPGGGDHDAFIAKIQDTDDGGGSLLCAATTTVASQSIRGLSPDGIDKLTRLRRFRDRVLGGLPEGPSMVDAYYHHSPEVSARLLRDPALLGQALALLGRGVPQMESALETGQIRLSASLQESVRSFARNLMDGASPALRADLQWFLKSDVLDPDRTRVEVAHSAKSVDRRPATAPGA